MRQFYDAVIIGAGQAGPPLAGRLTASGMKVALIERHLFGGTCVNTGCMPTKTLIASAQTAHQARRAPDFGVKITGSIEIDLTAAKARKDAVSKNAREGVENWLRGMDKCSIYNGHARFESSRELRVGEDLLVSDRIFINVGGRAYIPEMPGLDRVNYLTNTSILDLDTVPRHLTIVGGSYIGLEFAQMYRRFGSEVTVVEMAPRLIQREDEDVSTAVEEILRAEGINIRLNAKCVHFDKRNDGVILGVDCASGEPELFGTHALLAVGRRPNTDDLDVNKAGLALDSRGYLAVDDQLRTNVPGIWALGDCNGKGAFTHTAYNDFEIVAANLLDNESRRVTDRIGAYALYVDPPLGRVGCTESEARRAGRKVRVGKRLMKNVGRAIEKGETQGFMKIVVDADTDAILGAAILGVGGDEAIHGVLDVMAAKAPYTTLQHAVPIHPTVSELIPTMLGELRP